MQNSRFGPLIALVQLMAAGNPAVEAQSDAMIAAIQAEEANLATEIADHEARITALENGVDQVSNAAAAIDGAATPSKVVDPTADNSATTGSALGGAPAAVVDPTGTDAAATVVDPTAAGADVLVVDPSTGAATTADPSLTSGTTVGGVPVEGVETDQAAAITPIDPSDPLRAGAGTSVTSPAPAAVPESAEPVSEEIPPALQGVAGQAASDIG